MQRFTMIHKTEGKQTNITFSNNNSKMNIVVANQCPKTYNLVRKIYNKRDEKLESTFNLKCSSPHQSFIEIEDDLELGLIQ